MRDEVAHGFDNADEEGTLTLIQMGLMFTVPLSLRAAVLLGVPKLLKDAGANSKLSAEEIARIIPNSEGAVADSENLDRILRILAAFKIVTESASPSVQNPNIMERRYGFTSSLNYLTDDKDGASLVPLLLHLSEPILSSNCQLLHEVVLNKNVRPQEVIHGMNLFEWYAKNPESGNLFDKAMADHSYIWTSKLLQIYNGFERLSSIVDVGGGLGRTLALILSKIPHLRGINYDLPHVVANGVQAPRLEHVGGDFFESVPQADAAFMKWILHDWDDESCVKILKNIEKALPPNGKIITVDSVLPEITDSSPLTITKLCFDVHMMANCPGGKERTENQFRKLAAQAGFQRVVVAATLDNLSLIEFYRT